MKKMENIKLSETSFKNKENLMPLLVNTISIIASILSIISILINLNRNQIMIVMFMTIIIITSGIIYCLYWKKIIKDTTIFIFLILYLCFSGLILIASMLINTPSFENKEVTETSTESSTQINMTNNASDDGTIVIGGPTTFNIQSDKKNNEISHENADINYLSGNLVNSFNITEELTKRNQHDCIALNNLGLFYATKEDIEELAEKEELNSSEENYKKAEEYYNQAIKYGSKKAFFNKFSLQVKKIRNYNSIIELLNTAYEQKNEEIANYVGKFIDDERNDMDKLASIIQMNNKDFKKYIESTFYEWKLDREISVPSLLSSNNKFSRYDFLYSIDKYDSGIGSTVTYYYYRKYKYNVIHEDLLKEQYEICDDIN